MGILYMKMYSSLILGPCENDFNVCSVRFILCCVFPLLRLFNLKLSANVLGEEKKKI